jgi:hypothetical protein
VSPARNCHSSAFSFSLLYICGETCSLTRWQHHTRTSQPVAVRTRFRTCHAALEFRHRPAILFSMLSDVSTGATVCSSPARILRDIQCALQMNSYVPLYACITSRHPMMMIAAVISLALLFRTCVAVSPPFFVQFTSHIPAQWHQVPSLVMVLVCMRVLVPLRHAAALPSLPHPCSHSLFHRSVL